jgi:hypothetical protein
VKESAPSREERRRLYDEINLEYFVPFIKELMKSGLCAGCHIMAVHYTELIPHLLSQVGVVKLPFSESKSEASISPTT